MGAYRNFSERKAALYTRGAYTRGGLYSELCRVNVGTQHTKKIRDQGRITLSTQRTKKIRAKLLRGRKE